MGQQPVDGGLIQVGPGVFQVFAGIGEFIQRRPKPGVFKGLYQVIDHAAVQQGFYNVRVVGRGHHDHGRRFAGGMEGVEKFASVHRRHIIIQDDQIRVGFFQIREGLRAVFKNPVGPERGRYVDILPVDGGNHGVVLDDNYSVHSWCSFRVKVIVKQVPSPASVSIEMSPPYRSVTWRIR